MAWIENVKLYLYESKSHKYFGLWAASLGIIVGVLTNGVIFALSTLIFLLFTLIIFLPWRKLDDKWRWKGNRATKWTFSLLVCAVIGVLFWQPLVSVYPQLDVSSNLYVRPTSQASHVFYGYTPKHKYQLLLEFGALRKEQYLSGLGIIVDVSGHYSVVDRWWDDPKLTSISNRVVYPFDKSFYVVDDPGLRQSWAVSNIKENGEAPLYTLSFDDVPITGKRSLYIYFESDYPLKVKSLTLGGMAFQREGNLFIPKE